MVLKLADTKGIRSYGRDIYSVNFANYLPETLKRDTKMKALAEAVTEQMLGVSAEVDNVLIYSRIDELPEELVDILAYDMHVDWYDYAYPLTTKRDVLKSSVKVHKKLGTKYAVETALRAVHKSAAVSEWFEYGGEPYHFKLDIDISKEGMSAYTGDGIASKVRFYKNLRSHCDGIYYRLGMDPANVSAAAAPYLGAVLKVKALLKDHIKAEESLPLLSSQAIGGAIKVKAALPEHLAGTPTDRTAALAGPLFAGDIRVKAYLEASLDGRPAERNVQAGVVAAASLKVKPGLREGLGVEMEVKEQGHTRMENRLTVRKE